MRVDFQQWTVEIRFRERVLGGIPKNPKIFDAWVKSQKFPEEVLRENIEEAGELEEEAEAGETIFRRDAQGLFLRDFQAKANLKEAAQRLGYWMKLRRNPDGLSLKSHMQTGLYVRPRRLYLYRDGRVLTAPDGVEDAQGRVPTPRGMKSILRRSEYVERASLTFQILLLPFRGFGEEELAQVLALGQEIGLGSWRGREEGKFDVVRFAPSETERD